MSSYKKKGFSLAEIVIALGLASGVALIVGQQLHLVKDNERTAEDKLTKKLMEQYFSKKIVLKNKCSQIFNGVNIPDMGDQSTLPTSFLSHPEFANLGNANRVFDLQLKSIQLENASLDKTDTSQNNIHGALVLKFQLEDEKNKQFISDVSVPVIMDSATKAVVACQGDSKYSSNAEIDPETVEQMCISMNLNYIAGTPGRCEIPEGFFDSQICVDILGGVMSDEGICQNIQVGVVEVICDPNSPLCNPNNVCPDGQFMVSASGGKNYCTNLSSPPPGTSDKSPFCEANPTDPKCVVVNKDCVGSWSTCSNGFRVYTVTEEAFGTGDVCEEPNGTVEACDNNCEGYWGACTAGVQKFVVTRAATGAGVCVNDADGVPLPATKERACASSCTNCDCVGSWGACNTFTNKQTFSILQVNTGTGSACTFANNETRDCDPLPVDCSETHFWTEVKGLSEGCSKACKRLNPDAEPAGGCVSQESLNGKFKSSRYAYLESSGGIDWCYYSGQKKDGDNCNGGTSDKAQLCECSVPIIKRNRLCKYYKTNRMSLKGVGPQNCGS